MRGLAPTRNVRSPSLGGSGKPGGRSRKKENGSTKPFSFLLRLGNRPRRRVSGNRKAVSPTPEPAGPQLTGSLFPWMHQGVYIPWRISSMHHRQVATKEPLIPSSGWAYGPLLWVTRPIRPRWWDSPADGSDGH